MKVYTDYGTRRPKALESCLIVIEDTSEWTHISHLFKKDVEQLEKDMVEHPDWDWAHEKKWIELLKQAIVQLEPKNTIPLEQFDVNKLPRGLWKKN